MAKDWMSNDFRILSSWDKMCLLNTSDKSLDITSSLLEFLIVDMNAVTLFLSLILL